VRSGQRRGGNPVPPEECAGGRIRILVTEGSESSLSGVLRGESLRRLRSPPVVRPSHGAGNTEGRLVVDLREHHRQEGVGQGVSHRLRDLPERGGSSCNNSGVGSGRGGNRRPLGIGRNVSGGGNAKRSGGVVPPHP